MHVILDHLGAILVASVLLVIFGVVQLRGQQSSIDAQRDRIVKARTYNFAKLLERDLENMRSEKQAQDSLGTYECRLERTDSLTTQFTFPTLLADASGGNPMSAPIVHVTYELKPAGTTNAMGKPRMLYKVDRSVDGYPEHSGSSGDVVTDFRIDLLKRDGTPAAGAATTTDCAAETRQVRVQMLASMEGVTPNEWSAGSHFNAARYGITLQPPNLSAQ